MRIFTVSACFLLIVLAGCNSDSSQSKDTVPKLNNITVSTAPLMTKPKSMFERHLKHGVYLQHQGLSLVHILEDGAASDNSATQSYSTTNVQEVGVDEGDRVKYNGDLLFIASNNYDYAYSYADNSQPSEVKAKVRVLRKSTSGELSHLTDISLAASDNEITQLYLAEDTLTVMSQKQMVHIEPFGSGLFQAEQAFSVEAYNVASPANPQKRFALSIDGQIIDTRRINNTLYVVSSFSPSVADLKSSDTEEDRLYNYQAIMAKPLDSLLPKYTDANGNEQTLTSSENCYLPLTVTDKDGFNGIVTLTALDINNGEVLHSTCVNTQIDGIYATPNSIYLYGTDYVNGIADVEEKSVIHKFSLETHAIEYQASGTLKGRFNWHMSNLRFSEHDGYLRVVTTEGDQVQGFDHRLNILSQQQDELALISQLPSEGSSVTLGKRNSEGVVDEDIKAVRFYQDRAFIVTYRTIDPLYVLDLTDPETPAIKGELEIPGYSAYLHPLNERLLIGVGQQVDPDRLVGSGASESNEDSPIIEGAKISLFDISDISAPKEASSIVFENGYTPVEYDYHAFTSLKVSDLVYRVTIPIERWGVFTDDGEQRSTSLFWQQENYLALVEVSIEQSDPEMAQVGSIYANDSNNGGGTPYASYVPGWQDRSVIDGDNVYYIHGDRVWHGAWGSWLDTGVAY